MLQENKTIGVQPSTPGIAPEIEGAPVSMPGGNDGTDKTKMSGTPVSTASVPPPVATDVAGAPQAGQVVQSVNTAPPDDNGGETKPVTATDTDPEPASPSDDDKQRADAVAGSNRQIKTIQDWMDAEENRPETKEQRKKRERREKSKRIIAAISDGISALSNLYFTSQYAPNMYNHEKGSMTNAVDARIEKAKAERDKKRDQYMNFALKLGDIENDRAKTLRELEAQQEARKIARQQAEQKKREHEAKMALAPFQQKKAENEALESGYKADTAYQIALNKPKELELKNATETARAGSYKASAANSYASANAHDSSRRSKTHHFRGKEYVSEKDYTKDVAEAARQYNERHKDEAGFKPIVLQYKEETAYGERIRARKPEEYAGEVERRLEEEQSSFRVQDYKRDKVKSSSSTDAKTQKPPLK